METQRKGSKRTMKTTLHLDKASWKALRVRAIEEGTSATRLVEQLIRDYLKARKGGRR